MNVRFERSGPLKDVTSYPQWAQDMVGECDSGKKAVVDHELWGLMCSSECGRDYGASFLIGVWPVIERFPAYMAQSLLKTRYGRSDGDNLARRWLVRNIRVEQNHAEYWLNWAEGSGVPRDAVLNGPLPAGSQVLANWLADVSGHGTLAASIAGVNYAVEGATGEWSQRLYDDPAYTGSFSEGSRKSSLRWLHAHAAYDDTHPWEALEIVCTLLGGSPTAGEVAHIQECVKRSYASMCVTMGSCIKALQVVHDEYRAVAVA